MVARPPPRGAQSASSSQSRTGSAFVHAMPTRHRYRSPATHYIALRIRCPRPEGKPCGQSNGIVPRKSEFVSGTFLNAVCCRRRECRLGEDRFPAAPRSSKAGSAASTILESACGSKYRGRSIGGSNGGPTSGTNRLQGRSLPLEGHDAGSARREAGSTHGRLLVPRSLSSPRSRAFRLQPGTSS